MDKTQIGAEVAKKNAVAPFKRAAVVVASGAALAASNAQAVTIDVTDVVSTILRTRA